MSDIELDEIFPVLNNTYSFFNSLGTKCSSLKPFYGSPELGGKRAEIVILKVQTEAGYKELRTYYWRNFSKFNEDQRLALETIVSELEMTITSVDNLFPQLHFTHLDAYWKAIENFNKAFLMASSSILRNMAKLKQTS